jgi:REP element-mobilizing transposase RayT
MARPLRIEYPGAVYHVTSRGNARQDIVADDRDRSQFLTMLAHVVDRFGWRCHAYCLMNNHYHLLLETPQPNLSLGMRQLNGRYTQAYNRRHERVGHLFQGRFTAILVEKEAHLLELCRYVVLNPFRAKMVSHPRLWAWSSYRATVGETQAPNWLTIDWILGQFSHQVGPARDRYRTFVAEGRGGPQPWDQLTGQIYLGSEDFVAQHQPNRVIRDIPRRQTQAHRPPLREVFQRRGGEARLIDVAYRQYGYRLTEIADHLGVHYATVSRRLKQAEQRRGKNA